MSTATLPPHDVELADRIERSCQRIAPTWPLDRLVAVNPYWGWRALPVADAGARLGVLAGTRLTAPRSWYRDEWRAGRLAVAHIERAAAELGYSALVPAARAVLEATAPPETPVIERLALATDLAEAAGAGPAPAGRGWPAHVTHQISQHCAAHEDRAQAGWHPDRTAGLYRGWRTDPSTTKALRHAAGSNGSRLALDDLPDGPHAAIDAMLRALAIPPDGQEDYLTALLLSINGWASWFAHHRWEARLAGGDDDRIVDLLAIRLTWEWWLCLAAASTTAPQWQRWAASWTGAAAAVEHLQAEQRVDWILQLAVERRYQDGVVAAIAAGGGAEQPETAPTPQPQEPHTEPRPGAAQPPAVQAVFCIDVRSEVLRRALEATAPQVQTRGFAGFFGLPITYQPARSCLRRPQLPALLAPTLRVTETVEADGEAGHAGHAGPAGHARRYGVRRRRTVADERRWAAMRSRPTSMFTYVETLGLTAAVELVAHSLPGDEPHRRWEQDALGGERAGRRLVPGLTLAEEDPVAAGELAARILRAMGLVADFAPTVLLCGHGAQTANNPQAAGLHCGACGGQRGDVNARAAARLFNDPAIRAELARAGIHIPDSTRFVAGLHNTTTDEVELFDTDTDIDTGGTTTAPRHDIETLRRWLDEASERARRERAQRLDTTPPAPTRRPLVRRLRQRANDWAEVRPEWGLAGNAAFIAAPRRRTLGVDLAGRVFLHDYDWRLDPDLGVLTLVMTAPMVLASWINLQYHGSTVDNARYGSGTKTLHNVVGAGIGLFEGNGGDLRTGLARQSLHDGRELRHAPLRLSAFIEAPRDGIEHVISTQPVVAELVDNHWLHLLRIDPQTGAVECRWDGAWAPARPLVAT